MTDSSRSITRRRSSVGERLVASGLASGLLSLWIRVPEPLAPFLQEWAPARLQGSLAHFHNQSVFPWLREWGLLALWFFLLLSALPHQPGTRLELTRSRLGVVGAVLLGVSGLHLLSWFGLPASVLPWGLVGLWVAASFGFLPGALVGGLLVGAALLTGVGREAIWLVVGRAVLPAFCWRNTEKLQGAVGAVFGSGLFLGLVLSVFVAAPLALSVESVAWLALGLVLELVLFVSSRGLGEKLLGFVSRERLYRLLDLENPLLQRMVRRAPGSFEHSRAMANLAEQATNAIGADALLTRVGAYYHDLGKSFSPKYFIENLEKDEISPHTQLSPRESARKIIDHVVLGVRLLREEGIPEPVVEFAYTHHGTQLVEYFLGQERRRVEQEGGSVNEAHFRYPGMKPASKETAILMLIDSIEAASRTVEQPDRARFFELVRRIVFSKLAAGQLDEAGLSLAELRIVCERTVETLVHMHHHRIKYPWQEEQVRQFGVPQEELRTPDPPEIEVEHVPLEEDAG